MTTQANLVAMIDALHTAWEWSADDALYLTLPLFHTHGLVVGTHCALAAGARVTIEPKFEVGRAIDALRAGDHTLFFGVPTLYVRLVEELTARRAAGEDTTFPAVRLFVSGSAPLSADTWTAFRDLTGQEILERYGMTETGMLLSNSLRGRRIPGTVGAPLPGVEARLVAGDVEGDEGEVQVRGANVFAGYWGAPEKTAEAFVEDTAGRSWFRTGDLGRRDPATGHVTLQGRASELILSGGFNVYPREIEEVLLAVPGVREAAVIGEPHPDFGQSPVAFLVADGVDETVLAAHCRRELAPFKLPRRFVVVDALPRNALGKVEKRKLVVPR
jgi:malonyl-CoA/methylmalonyl-CoA synthetase